VRGSKNVANNWSAIVPDKPPRNFTIDPAAFQGNSLSHYAVTVLAFACSLLARLALATLLGTSVPYLTFFPCIVLSAWYGGLGPGLLATGLSAAAATDLVLVPGGFTASDTISLLLFILIGIAISWLNHERGQLARRALQELTARRKSEALLIENEQRFRALIENSSDAIAIIDPHSTVIYASASTRRVLGYQPEEFVGRVVMDLLHPNDQVHAPALFAQLLAAPGNEIDNTVRMRHKDQTWRWIECVATNATEESHIRGIVVNYRDVTERRRLEEQYLQAQKMEAVGNLAGGIAHDFNNLLTIINGYSEFALESMEIGQPLYHDLDCIKKAGTQAAALTRQLLAFSRRQMLEPKALNLNVIVKEIERMLRRLIGADIDLAMVLYPDLGLVQADPGQIEQAIMNLVVNSRHAMPRGGLLAIETANVELDEAYARRHRAVVPGCYVMLAISDTGEGMTEEVQARIFEPFFTTKGKGEGTGLGLSMVYGFVKQSGGNIWVYSEPGKGTTFKIYLPRILERVPETPVEQPTNAAPVPRSETILVVEDEAVVRKLITSSLRKAGYSVFEASNGEEAISFCQAHTDPIDLVITDVVMPRVGGPELVKSLAGTRPGIRTLFVSGYTNTAVVRHGVLNAHTSFLQKPFTPAMLNKKVREVLDHK